MRIVVELYERPVPMLEMSTRPAGVPLTNQQAMTIAGWWGTAGSILGRFVVTGQGDHLELLAEIVAIMVENHPRDEDNIRDLFDLYAWVTLTAENYLRSSSAVRRARR